MKHLELREKLKLAKIKALKLKTKRAQNKAWELVRELRRELFLKVSADCSMYQTSAIKGTVLHFSPYSEHFLVSTVFGNMWLSPTADVLTKSWYSHTCCVEYTVGQKIVIEIEHEVKGDDSFICVVPTTIHGGTVNESQYSELCQRDDLAFFKYPDGHMTGLFKQRKSV
jgi:hypothetical protein